MHQGTRKGSKRREDDLLLGTNRNRVESSRDAVRARDELQRDRRSQRNCLAGRTKGLSELELSGK